MMNTKAVTPEVLEVIEILKAKQQAMGLSDELFSRRYNISKQAWQKVRVGERYLGLFFYGQIMRTDPDLKDMVQAAIMSSILDNHVAVVPEGEGLFGLRGLSLDEASACQRLLEAARKAKE